jgi:hypothetical protein
MNDSFDLQRLAIRSTNSSSITDIFLIPVLRDFDGRRSSLRRRLRRSKPAMDQQGRPNEPQLVYRRDPETGRPGEGSCVGA